MADDTRQGELLPPGGGRPTLRERIRSGETLLGSFVNLAAPALVEISALAGFDFLVLDTEHAPLDSATLENLCRTADSAGIATVVRAASLDPVRILRALDIGPAGVQIPMVASRDQAAACVDAARFAPIGRRGLSPYTRAARYFSDGSQVTERLNRETVVVVQIEGIDGIDALEQIVSVAGIDVVFLGPYDLSQAIGRPGDVHHREVRELMETAVSIVDGAGLAVGTYADHPDAARRWMDAGVRYMCLSVDAGIFLHGARHMVRAARAGSADAPGDSATDTAPPEAT